jgi:branched-chain amino acid transport system permease protein/neutral amino acid transport system permease protein
MSQITLAFGFGLVTASVLALAAVGFTLQFGVTNIFNLAYGEVMTIGMFAAYWVNVTLGWTIWLGVVAAAISGALASALLNRVVFVPFMRRGSSLASIIIVSLAVAAVADNAILAIKGPGFFSYSPTSVTSLHIAGMILTTQQLGIMAIGVASMVALHATLRYTRLGKAMRATAANVGLARTSGIPTDRVTTLAWLLSGALCGAGGATFAISLASFDHTTGATFLLVVIAAAVFGGVGQPYGAMLGAVVIGLATEISAIWIPNLKQVVAFGLLALMLLIRPNGLIPAPGAATEVLEQ